MGRLNPMCNTKKKSFETKRQNRMTKQAKSHAPTPKPTQDMWCESKVILKMILKKNGHAIYLKCSVKINLISSLWIAWKEECKPPHSREGVFTPMLMKDQ
jgi:hypothetical protein